MLNQPLKIASWNVNSVSVRGPQLIDWMLANQIDVIGIQETKVTDDKFPAHYFTEHGFHLAFTGQKTYNGVALVSRFPLTDVYIESSDIIERRIIAATIQDVRIVNLYVPNGSEVSSDKYGYKLRWLEAVTTFLSEQHRLFPKLVVMGDFNIAPEDIDVHDPQAWGDGILVSPLERAALSGLKNIGLHDSFRMCHPDRQDYSWWDYRAASFRRNRGLRIDLILLSDALLSQCQSAEIDANARKHERPSDHAPAWVSLKPKDTIMKP